MQTVLTFVLNSETPKRNNETTICSLRASSYEPGQPGFSRSRLTTLSFVPREAGFIILSLKGLRRDEISCGVYGHVYLFIYLSVRLVYAGNDVTRPCAGGLMV